MTLKADQNSLTDINARRKAQNRTAQRKYRMRQKIQMEMARAILSEGQRLQPKRGGEWTPPTEHHDAQAPLTIKYTRVSEASKSTLGLGGESVIQASEGITERHNMSSINFDSESAPDLNILDLEISAINPDNVDPYLLQLDWRDENHVYSEQLTWNSSSTSPLGDNMRDAQDSDVPDKALSISQSVLVSSTPVSMPQPSPTLSTLEISSSTHSPISSRPGSYWRSDTPCSNSSDFSVVGESSGPLSTAISMGSLEIARLLIRAGAEIDIPDKNGNTPLHKSIRRGDIKTACTLLKLGANILKTSSQGLSSLHIAVETDNKDMVRMLLDWCARNGERGSTRTEPGQNRTTNLLQRCTDARDARNMTALHLSVTLQKVEILKVLLEYGADVNTRSD